MNPYSLSQKWLQEAERWLEFSYAQLGRAHMDNSGVGKGIAIAEIKRYRKLVDYLSHRCHRA